MPWKLIIAIICIAILMTLIGFNWSFTSDISFGFKTFENVPVILTIGISFLAGTLFAIPYAVRSSLQLKKRQSTKSEKLEKKNKTLEKKLDGKVDAQKSGKTEKSKRRQRAKKNSPVVLPDVPADTVDDDSTH